MFGSMKRRNVMLRSLAIAGLALTAGSGVIADAVVSGSTYIPLKEAIGIGIFVAGLVIYLERRLSKIETSIYSTKTDLGNQIALMRNRCDQICKLADNSDDRKPSRKG